MASLYARRRVCCVMWEKERGKSAWCKSCLGNVTRHLRVCWVGGERETPRLIKCPPEKEGAHFAVGQVELRYLWDNWMNQFEV